MAAPGFVEQDGQQTGGHHVFTRHLEVGIHNINLGHSVGGVLDRCNIRFVDAQNLLELGILEAQDGAGTVALGILGHLLVVHVRELQHLSKRKMVERNGLNHGSLNLNNSLNHLQRLELDGNVGKAIQQLGGQSSHAQHSGGLGRSLSVEVVV